MPWNEDPKGKSPKDLNEEPKEDNFSFLQETIKPEPITGKQVRRQLLKLAVYGIVVGMFACLGFYALKPWVQKLFPESPKTVTIPEDTEDMQKESEEAQLQEEQDEDLGIEEFETMMQSIYQVAVETRKSVVIIRGKQDTANLTKDVDSEDVGCTGLIAADNGRELLILSNNSLCAESTIWNIQFSDGSICEASLKKQDKNSRLAVFAVKRELISENTWDAITTATLGNSNVMTEGEAVIALGDTFGYTNGIGYGIISSNIHEKAIPDHTFSVLATDIPSAGHSSSVLCNLNGEIIGLIDSEIWTENQGNTANAYGISDLKPIMESLLNGQPVPYAGIYGVTVSSDISESKQIPSGMYVTQVQADSPAMAAGIQSGDVIQSVDGEKITSMVQYEKVLRNCKAGETIRLQGKRLGAGGYVEISFQLTLDSRE